MKHWIHRTFLIITAITLISNTAYAQLGIRKGLKIGYNWSTVSGEMGDNAESRKSLTGGASLEFNILGLLSFQVDVLYSSRGAAAANGPETKLSYISVPIVLKQKFFPVGIHPYILGGPEFNYLISAKVGDTDIKNQLKTQDMTVVVGAGLEFSLLGNSAYVEGRYSYGISDVNKNATFSSTKNRVSQVFVGILF